MQLNFKMLDKYKDSNYIFAGSDIFTNISRTEQNSTSFCTCFDVSILSDAEIANLLDDFKLKYDNLTTVYDQNNSHIEFISRDIDIIYNITELFNPKLK